MMTAQLTIVDLNNVSHTRTISYENYYVAGKRDTGDYIIYFNGSAADMGFTNLGGGLTSVDTPADQIPAEGEIPADEYLESVDEVFAQSRWA